METDSLYSVLFTPSIVFLVCLCARAVFSFLETSITALRLFKLKELSRSIGGYQTLFQSLEKQPHRVLITILIANSFADVTTAALATHITETIFARFNLSSGLGFTAGIAIATIALLIFGEILPKNIAKGRSERLFKSTLWLTNAIFYLFYPVVTVLLRFSNLAVRLFSGKKQPGQVSEWVSSEREIRFLINYIAEQGIIEPEKTEMLQNVFELGRTHIKEIMVPYSDVVSVNIASDINNVLELFMEHHFTRLPVYRDSTDNFVGMIHLKDVFAILSKQEKRPLTELVRPIAFMPDSMKVNQLLREFRQKHMHIAMVLNEHGNIVGLITLEDVLEEIVGEISDEHEQITEKVIKLKEGGWLVDASIALEELGDFLSITFKTEDSITLGGFLTEMLQHMPTKGERFSYKDLCFQVQKATPKRVLQVLIFEESSNKTA